MSKEIGQCV